MTTTDRYAHRRYLLLTLDPVHPGAGGYRLGRVDNSIAREPGTRLPKIPGSSLHGAARAYAAYLYGTPEAAGQSQDDIDKPEENPVCYTFGYLKKKGNADEKAYSGVVNIFDAHLLLFPVHSVVGPVWVSTQERLEEACFTVDSAPEKAEQVCLTWPRSGRLNLGWLMLEVAKGQVRLEPPSDSNWKDTDAWKAIAERIVLVSRDIFGHIVNSNLEVRTSVAINPETGAAEEHALFTYEAIPRAAFLTAEVVLDDYNAGKNDRPSFPVVEKTDNGNDLPGGKWKDPLDVVAAGLKMIEYLSVGGMGTRGFGRIKLIGKPVEKKQEDIFKSLEEPA
jgi:CRISPR-associated protein Cmr4